MKAFLLLLSTFSIVTEAKSFLPTRINSSKPVIAERYQDNAYKVWKTEDFDEKELTKQTLNMLQFADNSINKRFSDIIDFHQIVQIQSRIIKEQQQKQYYLTLKYKFNDGFKTIYAFFNSLEDQNPKVATFNFQSDYFNQIQ